MDTAGEQPAAPRLMHLVWLYAAFASLWIVSSDLLVSWLDLPSTRFGQISMLKGLLFVTVTSLLLHLLLRRATLRFRRASEREQALQDEKLRALKLLDAIASGSTDAVFAKDREGRYILFNHAAERNMGKAASSVLGHTDTILFPRDDAALVMEDDRRIMQTGQVRTLEHFLPTAQGDRMFLTTLGPLLDEHGGVSGVFGVARDITERKQAEDALRHSEEMYHSLFENMLNSVAHVRVVFEGDRPVDMVYLSVNPAFHEVTGIREPVVGRRISEVIPGYCEHNQESLQTFGGVAKTGVPRRWEHYLTELDRWFAFMIYSPAPGEVIIITENIDERKKAEIALRERNDELERFNRAMVGRELDMVALKRKVNELSTELGRPPPYPLERLDPERTP